MVCVLLVNVVLLRGELLFSRKKGCKLTGAGGVDLESITVQLRTANSFMGRLVMQTRFLLARRLRELRDLSLGTYHTAELESTIVLSMEVSCCRVFGEFGLTICVLDVAFTFDDGPYNYTSDLLDKLKVYNAKATFMVTGNNLGKGICAIFFLVHD
jgi:hypothetical protein